jgi:hypothetical protein
MTPLHVLSVVFLAQDPTLPSLVVQVSDGNVRELSMFIVDDDSAPVTVQLREQTSTNASALPRWPLAPTGASIMPAVDGVIITIDDVGSWGAFPPAAAGSLKKAKVSTTLPWPPPALPVAGPNTLRLFVPAVVDGASTPATLHGQGFVVAGAAITFEGPLSPGLFTWREGNVARTEPTVVTTTPATDACAPHVSIALDGPWTATASLPACALGFSVSAVSGPILARPAGADEQIAWRRHVLILPLAKAPD